VLGHDAAELRSDVPTELAAVLRGAVASAKTPEDAAAACLALAVLRDPRGTEPVLELFGKSKDPGVRSYAALALGWMGSKESVDPLAELFVAGPRQGGMFSNAATALRLLGNATVVPGLIEHGEAELARKGQDESGLVACAGMLGKLGDPRSVPFLTKLARDTSARPAARASAAIALADLCDAEPKHWSCAVSTDLHFGLMASTLLSFSGNGTGLLEMR
jgi:HEAT repeat protein